jgi:BASS family bile acid:Na+ symporter
VNDQEITRTGEQAARLVKRHFLWLLLGCYALALFWPEPGLAMRQSGWSASGLGNVQLSLPLVLLALMLFCAALLTDLKQIRSLWKQPILVCLALAAVWLGPALLVVAARYVIPWLVDGPSTTGLLVGLALVAAMPVANSSVGWSQNADGNLAFGLALVVLSILLSPFATPTLLGVLGMSLSPQEQSYCAALVNQFSGLFFIVWVVCPTAAGFACRYFAGSERVARIAGWLTLASAAALLVLNYINSALALPKIYNSPVSLLAITAVLAAALSVVGLVLAWVISAALSLPTETRAALLFGLSMKHTGLALILAGAVLADQPLAILIVVLATFLQHLLAGIVQRFLERRQ